jgi:hypothetical protein
MKKFKPKFTKNDWNHLHDCWFRVKGTKPTQNELESLFDELPSDLQSLADEWGMNDTVFRDGVIEWIQEKPSTE